MANQNGEICPLCYEIHGILAPNAYHDKSPDVLKIVRRHLKQEEELVLNEINVTQDKQNLLRTNKEYFHGLHAENVEMGREAVRLVSQIALNSKPR